MAYVRFLLRSTNEHGVHSPFIYAYLTNCLYSGPRRHSRTSVDVLLKSIAYFRAGSAWFSPDAHSVKKLACELSPGLQDTAPYDILFLSGPEPDLLHSHTMYHNQSLCIVDQIHRSSEAREHWERMKGLEEVRVTIDAFFCGLVFFRREQARQHFTIRI